MISQPSKLTESVLQAFQAHQSDNLFTISISGIDAAGKGTIARYLQHDVEKTKDTK